MIMVSPPSVNLSSLRVNEKLPVSPDMEIEPSLTLAVKSPATVLPELVQYSVPLPNPVVVTVQVTAEPSLRFVVLGAIA